MTKKKTVKETVEAQVIEMHNFGEGIGITPLCGHCGQFKHPAQAEIRHEAFCVVKVAEKIDIQLLLISKN